MPLFDAEYLINGTTYIVSMKYYPSDNADLGFQAVGPALRIMQLNVEGLSAAITGSRLRWSILT